MSGVYPPPHYVSASEIQHGLDRADGMERERAWYWLARSAILALVYIGQQLEDVSREYAGRSVP